MKAYILTLRRGMLHDCIETNLSKATLLTLGIGIYVFRFRNGITLRTTILTFNLGLPISLYKLQAKAPQNKGRLWLNSK